MTESTKKIDLNRYSEFVEGVTSKASNDLTTFMDSLDRVDGNYEDGEHGPDVNVPLLITAAMGMSGESGEFSEIVKKIMFHGKQLTPEIHKHLQKELGDVIIEFKKHHNEAWIKSKNADYIEETFLSWYKQIKIDKNDN